MGAPEPEEIYERTRREGERRLSRPFLELVATAAAAGVDVAFGLVAFATLAALARPHFGLDFARLVGSIGFGVAFAFIVIGRSELFTENFLVPLAGLDRRRRSSWLKLLELWTVSPVFNIAAGALLLLVLSTHGVLPHGVAAPLVKLAEDGDRRSFVAAFLSAIGGGALITLMTWLVEGAGAMGTRIVSAWIAGALLTLAELNHVIVATLEQLVGIRYGAHVGWGDFVQNFVTAAAGNMVGGIGFVTLTRFMQAHTSGGG